MQSKKTTSKTPKSAEKATVAAPEKIVAEAPAKTRTVKSSTTKKSEGADMTSGKHLHKSASPVVAETVKPSGDLSARGAIKPLSDVPARPIEPQKIAELAYSYFIERGGKHGCAEEDWLRAERALGMSR